MRHVTTATTAALFALALTGAVARGQDARITTDTKVKSDNGKVVMMTGCVMIGGGTSFMLSNITAGHEQNQKGRARTGGPYALVTRDGLDLGPYINQKVELAGVVVPAAVKGDRDDKIEIKETTKVDVDNGPDRKSTAATTVKVARGDMHQFLVASVKPLAPNCDQ